MYLHNKKVLVLKGDGRQKYLTQLMRADGCKVKYEPELSPEERNEAVRTSEIVIAPVPAKFDSGQTSIDEYMNIQVLLGGCIPGIITDYCRQNRIYVYDYMKDEQLIDYNAIATAEGAIAETIVNSEINLTGSKCIVYGYGHCGRVLAKKLKDFGAEVTVAVRRSEVIDRAVEDGFDATDLRIAGKKIGSYAFIFNTIPSMVIDDETVEQVVKDAVIMDIASKYGGVDYEAAVKCGVKAIHSLGIPGKYSPLASAKGIYACIKRIE